jgi:hypothetical protein
MQKAFRYIKIIAIVGILVLISWGVLIWWGIHQLPDLGEIPKL